MAARGQTVPPPRREWDDLHPKDQQLKQTKKLCIEKNWGTPIEHCLPPEIRPRVELKKGAKARVGDPEVDEEIWWNWSVELFKSLEELSAMTEGNIAFARQLLLIEVEQRQANPKSSQRKVMEVLLGDVQKVVDEQRKRLALGYHSDVHGDAEASYAHDEYTMNMDGRVQEEPPRKRHQGLLSDARYESPHVEPLYHSGGFSDTSDNTYHGHQTHDDRAFTPAAPRAQMLPGATPYSPNPQLSNTERTISTMPGTPKSTAEGIMLDHVKLTELKARAASFRSEAARLEAESVQLEIRAREMREQLAKMG